MPGPAPDAVHDADADADWRPEPERAISDVETLKAISDPLRLQLLETMVRRLDPPWTVKELAAALDVPPTRLYHHVDLLLDRDLIRPAGRRLVSGIVETRYRVAAVSMRLDRSLFSGDTGEAVAAMAGVLSTLFDSARTEIERGLESGRIETGEDARPERKLFLVKGLSNLTPERARGFRERLQSLLDEFGEDETVGADEETYGLVVAIYPLDPASALDATYPERPE